MTTQTKLHNDLINDLHLFLGPYGWGESMFIHLPRYSENDKYEFFELLDEYINGLITLKREIKK